MFVSHLSSNVQWFVLCLKKLQRSLSDEGYSFENLTNVLLTVLTVLVALFVRPCTWSTASLKQTPARCVVFFTVSDVTFNLVHV